MRVFITGATGFVGQAIGNQLCLAGHDLTILVRQAAAPLTCEIAHRWRARTLAGDATRDGLWTSQLEGIDAAVHAVGIISEQGAATFENVHVQGTRRVLAALRQNHVQRLVHISALGTRPDGISRYHQTKWAAEEMVRHSGLNYTILRPSVIYGPQDHFVNRFARMSRFSPTLPVIGSGLAKLQPISVGAVAVSVAAALRLDKSIGRTLDLCGPEPMSLRTLLEQILGVLGRKRWIVPLPLTIARPMAAFGEWVFPAWLKQPPPLSRDQIIMLQEDNVGDPGPARDLFGFAEPGFREGIARFLAAG